MQRITKYKRADDGTYTAVISGLTLGNDETQLLDEGYSIAVDVKVYDPYKITDKQRRKIFALVNDIERHTGQPRDDLREMFADYVRFIYGYPERISLADCSKKTAGQIITVILEWVFLHDIPLNYKTSDLMKEDNYFIYLSTVKRKCVICGVKGELAHKEAVGAGRNRRKIDHYDHHILCLCRKHHQIQHDMGIDSFNKKYHLENSWVKVTPGLNKKLKGME